MSRSAVSPAQSDQAMLVAIDKMIPAHGAWEPDPETARGYVCRMWSRTDAVEARRALIEDNTIVISTSRDDDGRDWLWVAAKVRA